MNAKSGFWAGFFLASLRLSLRSVEPLATDSVVGFHDQNQLCQMARNTFSFPVEPLAGDLDEVVREKGHTAVLETHIYPPPRQSLHASRSGLAQKSKVDPAI